MFGLTTMLCSHLVRRHDILNKMHKRKIPQITIKIDTSLNRNNPFRPSEGMSRVSSYFLVFVERKEKQN